MLTAAELEFATFFGRLRNQRARELGGKNKHGLVSDVGDMYSINGVAGEIAFRNFMGWDCPLTLDTFRSKPDFLHDIEIKTLGAHWYDLWVRADDDPRYRFVLVTGRVPDPIFTIHGWAYGHEIIANNRIRRFAGREPVWTLEQSKLRSINSLLDFEQVLR